MTHKLLSCYFKKKGQITFRLWAKHDCVTHEQKPKKRLWKVESLRDIRESTLRGEDKKVSTCGRPSLSINNPLTMEGLSELTHMAESFVEIQLVNEEVMVALVVVWIVLLQEKKNKQKITTTFIIQ